MNPNERASLAEQLLGNALFHDIFTALERNAIEAMVWAADDEARARNAMRVQEIRSFRQDCEAALRNNQSQKAAVA